MSRTLDPNVPYLKDGKPIAGGYVYYGEGNQDPKLNPITIYSDENFTVPISQPQRTNSQGIIENPVFIVEQEYSYLVEDSLFNQILLVSALNPLGFVPPVTENMDMNGFTFDNVPDATENDQPTTLGQNNLAYPISSDTDIASLPDAISVTLAVPVLALEHNQQIIVHLLHDSNTIPNPTFKLEPFAARPIYRDNNEPLNIDDTMGFEGYIHLAYNSQLNKWCLSNAPMQGIIANDIDMDGFKHLNVVDPVLNNQYLTFGLGYKMYPAVLPSNGTSLPNVIRVDVPLQPDILLDGQQVIVALQHGANTVGAGVTFKFGSEPAKTIYRHPAFSDLLVGDTGGANYYIHLIFNLALDAWSLVNPIIWRNNNLIDNTISGGKLSDLSIGDGKIANGVLTPGKTAPNFLDGLFPAPVAGTNYVQKVFNQSVDGDGSVNPTGEGFTTHKAGSITLRMAIESQIDISLYQNAPQYAVGAVFYGTWNNLVNGSTIDLNVTANQRWYIENINTSCVGQSCGAAIEIRTANDTIIPIVS
jgi:hypothetical protein